MPSAMTSYPFTLADADLIALPSGGLYWPAQSTLCVSDLHLGKSGRMARRGGALLPPYEVRATLEKLDADVERTKPARVICLGDSFDDLTAVGELEDHARLWLARLMAAANYPRTKLRFDEYRRSLEDKAKAEAIVRRAESSVTRESDRVNRLRRSLESLRAQLALLRSQPNIDVRELQFLQEQIRNTSASLASAEDMEAKAQANLDRTKASTESAFVRADKAREDYVAALNDYEKPLAEIRAIAMTHGTAL